MCCARAVVLIGEATPIIEAALAQAGVQFPVVRAGDMHDAVRTARGLAQAGDAVVLSPACSSYDMFQNFRAPRPGLPRSGQRRRRRVTRRERPCFPIASELRTRGRCVRRLRNANLPIWRQRGLPPGPRRARKTAALVFAYRAWKVARKPSRLWPPVTQARFKAPCGRTRC